MHVLTGIDWGSSNLRAFRIAADGRILETRRADDGVFAATGDFAARLGRHIEGWETAPVMMCGMIGSDRGWIRAPYIAAPAGLDDLAGALVSPSPGVHIVPGVSLSSDDSAEVMRGEETLVAGFLARTKIPDATLCLPGTHSKWVRVVRQRVTDFRTYMTGELRALLLAQGALATDVPQVKSAEAFRDGLAMTGALTHRLFRARAGRLLGTLPAEHTTSFITGILIGEEIADEAADAKKGPPVFLIAAGAMGDDYASALDRVGLAHTAIDPEPLAALGLLAIASRAGLIA